MKTLTMLPLLLLACGQPPSSSFEDSTAPVVVELGVVTRLRETLATWPSCTAEARPVVWELTPRWCTHRFCGTECCNICSWSLRLVTTTGAVVAIGDPSALGLAPSGLECEAAAATIFLASALIDLDAHCVVR